MKIDGIEKKNNLVYFSISAMPIKHFDDFQNYANVEHGGSYWHAIKALMDFYHMKMIEMVNNNQPKVEITKKEIDKKDKFTIRTIGERNE